MTIFYFTSTGNCLAVAKQIGGQAVSIPQIIDTPDLHFVDDVIGLVFPIYGFGMPKIVRRFLEKVTWKADYAFAIGTYGNLPGSAMMDVQAFVKSRGLKFDYAESLLMVDNYLPGFDMANEAANLPAKAVEANLSRIVADIRNRKALSAQAGMGWRLATAAIQKGTKFFLDGKQGQKFIVDESCTRCGICAKVCPVANVSVSGQVTFGTQCEVCMGCIHQCPQTAIHLKNEKSEARWRHPEVTLQEIIAANNRKMEETR